MPRHEWSQGIEKLLAAYKLYTVETSDRKRGKITNYCINYVNMIHLDHEFSRRIHCVKSVQIRSFFWSLFFCIRTEYGEISERENTEYLSVFSPNAGKYGTEKTLYLDTLHAVIHTKDLDLFISSLRKFTSYYVAFNHPNYVNSKVTPILKNILEFKNKLFRIKQTPKKFLGVQQILYLNKQ